MGKVCTDLVQSKKLVELGLDANTADMKYDPRWDIPILINNNYIDNRLDYSEDNENSDIPAWSLSALLKLMPTLDYRNPIMAKDIFNNNTWRCLYHSTAIERLIDTKNYDNPLDAAFEMVCWLLENKII